MCLHMQCIRAYPMHVPKLLSTQLYQAISATQYLWHANVPKLDTS